jgi:hypothetical protein
MTWTLCEALRAMRTMPSQPRGSTEKKISRDQMVSAG